MAADPTDDLRRKFTVEEYELMGGTGILGDDRTELLDGEIVVMSPIGPFHAGVVDTVNVARRVHVHTDPADGAYRSNVTLGPGDVLVPTAIADVKIAVSDVLR